MRGGRPRRGRGGVGRGGAGGPPCRAAGLPLRCPRRWASRPLGGGGAGGFPGLPRPWGAARGHAVRACRDARPLVGVSGPYLRPSGQGRRGGPRTSAHAVVIVLPCVACARVATPPESNLLREREGDVSPVGRPPPSPSVASAPRRWGGWLCAQPPPGTCGRLALSSQARCLRRRRRGPPHPLPPPSARRRPAAAAAAAAALATVAAPLLLLPLLLSLMPLLPLLLLPLLLLMPVLLLPLPLLLLLLLTPRRADRRGGVGPRAAPCVGEGGSSRESDSSRDSSHTRIHPWESLIPRCRHRTGREVHVTSTHIRVPKT